MDNSIINPSIISLNSTITVFIEDEMNKTLKKCVVEMAFYSPVDNILQLNVVQNL